MSSRLLLMLGRASCAGLAGPLPAHRPLLHLRLQPLRALASAPVPAPQHEPQHEPQRQQAQEKDADDAAWGKAVADRRRERILTVPNVLSLGRVVASPVVGSLILHGRNAEALALFAAVGVTDFLDGWIARRFNQMTVLGTVLDPFADKLLMTVMTVALGMTELLPVPLAALIVTRDLGLIASGFVLRYMSLAPPRTFARYFDFKLPTAEVRPSTVSKVNTGLQLLLMGVSLGAPVFGFAGHPALPLLWWSVAGTTVASGLGYIFKGRQHVVFLTQKSQGGKPGA